MNIYKLITVVLLVLLALSVLPTSSAITIDDSPVIEPITFALSIHDTVVVPVEVVKPKPVQIGTSGLYDVLVPVCSCESTGRPDRIPQQYHADGSVIFGKINPLDSGMCQLNQRYWLDTAERLGYDIFTAEGNAKMANYIYDTQGLQPWSASQHCWGEY